MTKLNKLVSLIIIVNLKFIKPLLRLIYLIRYIIWLEDLQNIY